MGVSLYPVRPGLQIQSKESMWYRVTARKYYPIIYLLFLLSVLFLLVQYQIKRQYYNSLKTKREKIIENIRDEKIKILCLYAYGNLKRLVGEKRS